MKQHIQTQTEWEIQMSEKILQFIQNELYMDYRYFNHALGALVYQADASISNFSTDGTYLYFSTEQLLRVFEKNTLYLCRQYLHSVLHCLFAHLWIGGKRDPYLWGIACDIAVEYCVDAMKKPSTKRILSWQRQKIYEELKVKKSTSAAMIYRILYEMDPEEVAKLNEEFYTDSHRHWPKEENGQAMQAIAKRTWDKISRQTKMEQESRGRETEDGEAAFAAQLAAGRSRRSYGDFLQKFAIRREEMRCDPDEFDMTYYSYGLRVYKNMPLVEPVESRESKKVQEMVIVVDTSYSTSGELVRHFLEETFQMLTQEHCFFRKFNIRIIQCDKQVQKDQVVHSKEEIEALLSSFTVAGGGSTDFRPAFAYVNQLIEEGKMKEPGGLLYFTDGKGTYPKHPPAYQTAFLFLEDYEESEVPPWAMRLRLEPEDLR